MKPQVSLFVQKLSATVAVSAALFCSFPVMADTATGSDCVKPIDINQSDVSCLMTIRGIGQKMADKIINYRIDHGQFTAIDDLTAISGISDRKLAQWRPDLVVNS